MSLVLFTLRPSTVQALSKHLSLSHPLKSFSGSPATEQVLGDLSAAYLDLMSSSKVAPNLSPGSPTSPEENNLAPSSSCDSSTAGDERLETSEYGDFVNPEGVASVTADEDKTLNPGRQRRARPLLLDTNVQAGTSLPQVDDTEQTEATKEKPISWSSLPRKDQLLVLTLARLSEPLTQTSLGSYIFYQLKSFDPSLPDSTISSQAGVIHASFPAAQFLTAILWGRFADWEHGGRKRVLWIGLLGSMLSILGFGFSHSFPMAVCFRVLGGILNGNIGVMRTMISEIIKEKKYQSRAFLILPMVIEPPRRQKVANSIANMKFHQTFNIGVIIGPILGASQA